MFEVYYIGLTTGLRREELLGLKWEDLDSFTYGGKNCVYYIKDMAEYEGRAAGMKSPIIL